MKSIMLIFTSFVLLAVGLQLYATHLKEIEEREKIQIKTAEKILNKKFFGTGIQGAIDNSPIYISLN